MSKIQAYTEEEVRNKFLSNAKELARYWATTSDGGTTLERIEGAIFSLLNSIDGGSHLPAFDLVVRPHPDDKEYYTSMGSKYYEDGMNICDGELHSQFINLKE